MRTANLTTSRKGRQNAPTLRAAQIHFNTPHRHSFFHPHSFHSARNIASRWRSSATLCLWTETCSGPCFTPCQHLSRWGRQEQYNVVSSTRWCAAQCGEQYKVVSSTCMRNMQYRLTGRTCRTDHRQASIGFEVLTQLKLNSNKEPHKSKAEASRRRIGEQTKLVGWSASLAIQPCCVQAACSPSLFLSPDILTYLQ